MVQKVQVVQPVRVVRPVLEEVWILNLGEGQTSALEGAWTLILVEVETLTLVEVETSVPGEVGTSALEEAK